LTPEDEADEYRKELEQKQYEEFALSLKQEVDTTAKDIIEYNILKSKIKTRPLLPYPEDPLQK
jgi:hypothetical protein